MKNMTKVYHLNSDKFFNESKTDYVNDTMMRLFCDITMFAKIEAVAEAVKMGLYEKVAHVTVPGKDAAFQLTNHIEDSWTNNEGVSVYKELPRSTSVGDLLITDEGNFVVAGCGFKEVDMFI